MMIQLELTVHDIDVLTEWNIESLVEQLRKRPSCFFIEKASANWKETGLQEANDVGEARIHDYISNLQFRMSPTAFFQVNTLAAEKLYSLAGDWQVWVLIPCFLISAVALGQLV